MTKPTKELDAEKAEAKNVDDVPEGEISPDAAAAVAHHPVTEPPVPAHDKPGRTSKLEQAARDALAGKYGYGMSRRQALVAEGLDPNEVQRETVRIVNHL